MIRLPMAIGRDLDNRGIGDLSEIAATLGLPAKEVEKLLIRRHWRKGDLAVNRRRVGTPDRRPKGTPAGMRYSPGSSVLEP
jgi:hypothetical protein